MSNQGYDLLMNFVWIGLHLHVGNILPGLLETGHFHVLDSLKSFSSAAKL